MEVNIGMSCLGMSCLGEFMEGKPKDQLNGKVEPSLPPFLFFFFVVFVLNLNLILLLLFFF